ncbi:glycosyltransferase [Pseudalkalibacillus sp. R45]|uniref:glycosyltransferase n=1 Tax=Pseudalkalibacillus sp. R45 TaxID=3457433 RepID=UPI003FCEDA48
MNLILLYFPYELQKNPKSGSGVRPKKITEAFQRYADSNNMRLEIISGHSEERKRLTESFKQKGLVNETLFCYMENSTMPYWLTDKDHFPRHPKTDASFWMYLKKHKVPISLFYRDVYWKFDDMYVPPGGKKVFTPIMRAIYQKELRTFSKVVDLLYLPSLEMNQSVGWTGEYSELPPGMEGMHVQSTQSRGKETASAVFVGGISDQKGMLMLLEVFKKINATKAVDLQLVCRENEYRKYIEMHKYETETWLTVSHKSGQELKDVYEQADIALIPREINTYHDFAVPVKLFEYQSYGLPIVATNCKAQARILNDEKTGKTADDNAEDFSKAILEAIEPTNLQMMKENIINNSFNRHSWDARITKVVNDMTAIREGK